MSIGAWRQKRTFKRSCDGQKCHRIIVDMQAMSTCVRCLATKHLGHFRIKTVRSYHHVSSTCKSCDVRRHAEWRKRSGYLSRPKTKEAMRDSRCRRAYGISYRDKASLLERQGGKCANYGCQEPATHLDHNHVTGKIRAVLCRGCNTSLGTLKEDQGRIHGLAEYVATKPAGIGEALLWL